MWPRVVDARQHFGAAPSRKRAGAAGFARARALLDARAMNRWLIIVALLFALPASARPGQKGHSHCGWIGADTADAGKASFAAHADWFDAIHPKWFTLNSDGSPKSIAFTDDAQLTQTAHAHQVQLIPLIDSDKADYVRVAMANPARHAQELADLVTRHGYDGLELDYEHLWSKGDRAGFIALVTQVATALHAHGKVVTMALPAMDHDDGNNAYNYTQLQKLVDEIHLMAYDFHSLDGPHLGPLAPLGWVTDVVARVEKLGAPQKYILGLANYGIGKNVYFDSGTIQVLCHNSYERQTNHMATCSLGHQAAGTAPHCVAPNHGEMWFEDATSLMEKADAATTHKLGGIAFWTLGNEVSGLYETLSDVYP
jgi:spore germination protein YaaH